MNRMIDGLGNGTDCAYELNQLTSKSYTDGTSLVNYSYNQGLVSIGNWSSGSLLNPIGHLTAATTTVSGPATGCKWE